MMEDVSQDPNSLDLPWTQVQSQKVRCTKSRYPATRSGGGLMQIGIELGGIEPGELIFLNQSLRLFAP